MVCSLVTHQPLYAQPYGVGKYNENVPYGDLTSISIALSQPSANITLSPTAGDILSGHETQNITVYSTDVIGYQLLIKATGSTALTHNSHTLPASNNTLTAPLSVNSWGYNTTGSTTNFRGVTTDDVEIRNENGPLTDGQTTSVTYGARVDMSLPAGSYAGTITYTAVGKL